MARKVLDMGHKRMRWPRTGRPHGSRRRAPSISGASPERLEGRAPPHHEGGRASCRRRRGCRGCNARDLFLHRWARPSIRRNGHAAASAIGAADSDLLFRDSRGERVGAQAVVPDLVEIIAHGQDGRGAIDEPVAACVVVRSAVRLTGYFLRGKHIPTGVGHGIAFVADLRGNTAAAQRKDKGREQPGNKWNLHLHYLVRSVCRVGKGASAAMPGRAVPTWSNDAAWWARLARLAARHAFAHPTIPTLAGCLDPAAGKVKIGHG